MLAPVSTTQEHLDRWQQAGLLDGATAERIAAFERGAATTPEEPRGSQPGALEAMLYLGAAVITVGAVLLAGDNWGNLDSWARVALLASPALFLLLVGALLVRSPRPELRRGGQVAWLAALVLTTATIAVVFAEYGSLDDGGDGQLLLVGTVSLALAVALFVIAPSQPQVAGLGGAAFFLGQAFGTLHGDFSAALAGGCVLVFGAAGLVLTEGGRIRPLPAARVVFAALAAVGAYEGSLGSPIWMALLAFAAGAALIAASVNRRSFVFMLFGVTLTFAELITFIIRHFHDRLGVPIVLMISGGLVVAGVVIVAQLRGRLQRRTA
ncbi:hypothetical protein AYO38_03105 [bacterium SCGC AG-212-C10]|nr:hypothetical protein AYO38_03105 [bacterium SCGC AG-212-C10]